MVGLGQRMDLVIVTPVLNDWESCRILLGNIDRLALPDGCRLSVLIVDDGSARTGDATLVLELGGGSIAAVDVVQLACNVGHQRAIALGISTAVTRKPGAFVLVMDCDGEDNPAEIPRLIQAIEGQTAAAVVAERARRSEGAKFRAGYAAYQALFRMLVGKRIDFGNFCLLGPDAAYRLAHMADTWNHLAATLLRARIRLISVPTDRTTRYAGQSSMNMPSLVAHGLSAFAVFSDHVFARLLLLASLIGVGVATIGIVVLCMRLFTDLATPGWASTVLGASAILFVQAILICLVAAVQMLATRSQPGAQPIALLPQFVRTIHTLLPRPDAA